MESEELIPQGILWLGLCTRGDLPVTGNRQPAHDWGEQSHILLRCPFPLLGSGVETVSGKTPSPECLESAQGACGTRKAHTSLLQTLNLLLMFWRSRISSARGRKAQRGTVRSKRRKHLKLCPARDSVLWQTHEDISTCIFYWAISIFPLSY